jgi:hypothetical protein
VSPAETAAASLHSALSDAHQAAEDVAVVARMLIKGSDYTAEEFSQLGVQRRVAMDGLYYRFNTLVSVLQDRVFKSIAVIEQEDIPESRRGLTDLMERIGVLSDGDAFRRSALARNRIAHTYIKLPQDQADRLNLALHDAVRLMGFFNEALDFVVRRRLLPIQPLSGLERVEIEAAVGKAGLGP